MMVKLSWSLLVFSDERVEELKIIFLEQEIKELKKALRDEKIRSHDLAVMVEEGERLKHLNRQYVSINTFISSFH